MRGAEDHGALRLLAIDRDLTIESDLHRLIGDAVRITTTRIPLESTENPEALIRLADAVEPAIRLLRPAPGEIVVYGCTSSVALVGAETVEARVGSMFLGSRIVDPLGAIATGLAALARSRIGLVSPYAVPVHEAVRRWMERRGFDVASSTAIDTHEDEIHATIDAGRIAAAARRAAKGVDAVVISCTALRTLDSIESIESDVGVPILTSNQALGWRVAKMLELGERPGPGALWRV